MTGLETTEEALEMEREAQAEEAMQEDLDVDHILHTQLHGLSTEGNRARSVFGFATTLDLVVIAISCLAAIIAGGLNPLLTVLYGQLVGSFTAFKHGSIEASALRADIASFSLYFVYLGIAMFVAVYVTTVGFYYSGERITRNLRRAYLHTTISQNIAFFDTFGAGELTTRITSDITLIQEGITGNLSFALTAAATFVSAFVIAFVEYWKLALILSSTIVLLTITGVFGVALPVKWTKQSLACYSSGATVAEEAISAIKHVTAFGIQEQLAERYGSHLKRAERPGFKAGVMMALMNSLSNAIPYLSYALSFWEGSRLIVAGDMSVPAVTTSTLAIVIGAWAIGRVAPNAKAFISSMASATVVLDSIARQSPQDALSDDGKQLESVDLDITFRNVQLIYPSRREVLVLDAFNLVIPAAKVTAIIGASGCGKSSVIGLLQRFYSPTKGQILIGKDDISSLNLHCLREAIALVGQEPVLFNTTIFENIIFGLDEEEVASLSTIELVARVDAAAAAANAHGFISDLPRGYQTLVGEKGLQLSGGQRQRICIARAIIKNPHILLLDEATSALDVEAERSVQLALAAAVKNRTTIVIAHRLSTIRNADNIVVMSEGRIVEQGTHSLLMSMNGHYTGLVEKQRLSGQNEKDSAFAHAADIPSRDVVLTEKDQVPDVSDPSSHQTEKTTSLSPSQGGSRLASPTSFDPPKMAFPWSDMTTAMRLISQLNRPEMILILIGAVLAVLGGLSVPAQSFLFAQLINALSLTPTNRLRDAVDLWSLMYFIVGIAVFIVMMGQGSIFAFTTEKLVHRARERSFKQILRQDIPYFDQEQHSIGALTALLSSAPTDLNGLSGPVLGALLTFTATILGGIVLSLIVGWKLALVCTATIPFVAGFGWIRLIALTSFAEKMKQTHQDSATYANEATSAIRTVASLAMEKRVLKQYDSILMRQSKASISSILQASALYAASMSVTMLCCALAFWYGGNLLASHEYTILQFFICFAALVSGAQTAGVVFSYAPGMSRAFGASRDLRTLFDCRPEVDSWSVAGQHLCKEACAGSIEFRNVVFSYPSRPERIVLNNFNLTIYPGQFIALVGQSGCGKSTLISLLERFYDPTSDQILLDGLDITALNVQSYRSCISIVGQEPIIFSGTIRENLMLGAAISVTDEAIVHACKEANIYDTILSLPDGFNTNLGSRGVMLSGGQRQRIAIARALLRNTKILLLDEATAALDSGSEAIVQDALNQASKSRTTVVVAHRLSTIQHADVICVLEKGKLVEVGNHRELMLKKGMYAGLVDMQSRGQGE